MENMGIVVTLLTNIDEDGEMIDKEAYGYLVGVRTEPITTVGTDQQLKTYIEAYALVLWDDKRSPCPDFVDRKKLYWWQHDKEVDLEEGDEDEQELGAEDDDRTSQELSN